MLNKLKIKHMQINRLILDLQTITDFVEKLKNRQMNENKLENF